MNPTAAPDTGGITDEDTRWIVRNGVGIQIMETLAVGTFLTAFAVSLDASNFTIGVLAAIPHLSQLAQVPALYVIERVRRRRLVYRWSGVIARPMLLVIGLAAFLPSPDLAILVIAVAFAVRYAAGSFLACSWNSWMRDLVPDDAMGRVFGGRQQAMIGIGIVLSVAAALFIDWWQAADWAADKYAYSVTYTLAFLGGMYSVVAAARVTEPPMAPAEDDLMLFERLKAPFSNRNFRQLLAFLSSWNFAVNLAAPFFTVHMLKRMELPLTWVVILGVLSQAASYLFVQRWGRIADRFANKSVLGVCGPLFILGIFAWTFTMFPERHALTIPLLIAIHLATGVAAAGVTLASGNITMKLAPRGGATSYLATSAMCNALAAGVASVIGGLTADFFLDRRLSLIARWQSPAVEQDFTTLDIEQWDFFFLISVLVGLYSLHRLSLITEKGHVNERVVVENLFLDLRHGIRNLSSVAGLRAATTFPIDLIRKTHGETRRILSRVID